MAHQFSRDFFQKLEYIFFDSESWKYVMILIIKRFYFGFFKRLL